MWVSEEGQEFENFSKTCCFLNFEWYEPHFTTFGPPYKNFWKNPLVASPWKNPFRRPCTQACKMTPFFMKICVVLHHLAALFNNTNAVSNP